MSDRDNHSPTGGRIPHRRGATHARIRARRSRERGSSPAATTARNRRAIAALDRWQLEHAVTPADPLDAFAAYADWIRAEIKLARKLWAGKEGTITGEMADTMHRWALHIDQQIRDKLGEPS